MLYKKIQILSFQSRLLFRRDLVYRKDQILSFQNRLLFRRDLVWFKARTKPFPFREGKKSAWVAELDAPSDWRPGGRGFNPRRGQKHSFVEIDHEIFSTVILSLPLIQEGQLSVSGERMCTILVNCLED